jgi:arylsulfatase A
LPLYDADAASGKVTHTLVDGSPELQQQFYARAERFIEENRDRPFYLHLTLSSPHLPSHPHPDFAGKSKAGAYGDTVLEIDSIMGRLLAKLKALNIDKDTVVFLTSDNGAWFEGSNGPLRDRKGGPGYDGGYRVPLIAWAPGRIKPGRSNAIMCGTDFLPTLCSMADCALPAGVEIDGLDVSGVLTRGEPSPHNTILLFNNEDVVALRTQRWKYVAQTSYRNLSIPLPAAGYPELYDMNLDRSESYSLAANNPDVVKDMQEKLLQANVKFAPFKSCGRRKQPQQIRKDNENLTGVLDARRGIAR